MDLDARRDGGTSPLSSNRTPVNTPPQQSLVTMSDLKGEEYKLEINSQQEAIAQIAWKTDDSPSPTSYREYDNSTLLLDPKLC